MFNLDKIKGAFKKEKPIVPTEVNPEQKNEPESDDSGV